MLKTARFIKKNKILPFLHFSSVKSYNFCYFLFLQSKYVSDKIKKKFLVIFYFHFFPSSDLNILKKKKSVNQVLKKIRPKVMPLKDTDKTENGENGCKTDPLGGLIWVCAVC